MKRLVWCMGWPAAYFRRLHKEIDNLSGISPMYLYYPFKTSLMNTRSYEEGDLSSNSLVVNKTNHKKVNKIISECLQDENAVMIICGSYPRKLLSIIFRLRKAKCSSYYCSDDNIFDQLPGSFLYRTYQRFVLNSFKGYFQIGTTNAFYQLALLGKKNMVKRHCVQFPYPHFPDEVETINKIYCPDNIIRFLFMGRVTYVKNVESIIKAAVIILEQGINNFSIEIAGTGDSISDVKNLVEEHNLKNNICLSGIIKTSDRKEVFARNDVLVLPSHNEPWGLVVNEALSAKMPVISSSWAGAAFDLIIDGVNGYKLNSNDPLSIADALIKYCKNPDIVIKQSRYTSILVKKRKFTYEKCLETIIEICS